MQQIRWRQTCGHNAPTIHRVTISHHISRLTRHRQQHLGRSGLVLSAQQNEEVPIGRTASANVTELSLPYESQQAATPVTNAEGVHPLFGLMKGLHKQGDVLNGQYTVQEVLGVGANAVTYRATTPEGRPVAIKALSLRGLRDWKQLEMFQREAAVLQSLDHPSVPKYLGYFEEDTDSDRAFYLVQEAADGTTLQQMVAAGMRASEEEVLRIARELLAVLQYLGALRPSVTHRDVKPENIVIEGGTWGGRVFLVDFGGVQASALAAGSLGSTIVGTYGYMAPEQFRGSAMPASDLYGLGGTLLYLTSGQPPSAFPQERMKVVWQDRVQAGPLLIKLLEGLLQPLAEDRLTAEEALSLLDGNFTTSRMVAAPQQQQQQQQQQLAQRSRLGGGLLRKPKGSRVEISSTPGKLLIDIPPQGMTGSTVATGSFAVVWNAFVAVWTAGALASGGILFALFSLPFWFAGGQLASQTLLPALLRETLEVGRNRFRLSRELGMLGSDGVAKFVGGGKMEPVVGQKADLRAARVVTTMIVNGEPKTAIELIEGVDVHRFGEGLSTVEQEWIVQEVNRRLAESAGGQLDLEGLPQPAEPKVVNSDDESTDDDD